VNGRRRAAWAGVAALLLAVACGAAPATVEVVAVHDGEDVNLAMVRAGLAWHYRYHCPDDRTLAEAEAEARAARRGLWADGRPEAPWEWRRHR
jgi:endonuclease YncB( thermonuclease family)